MIFIGAELSDPNAHFVTNIIDSIGDKHNLIIDLLNIKSSEKIYSLITEHLQQYDEKYVIYNPSEAEDFFIQFKRLFPELFLITVFSDDEWRHSNYDRYIALYSDIFTIAVKDNLSRYQGYGMAPAYMQWACNPKKFYPIAVKVKDIDISFIGAAYGKRIDFIRFLVDNGVSVRIYGYGWDRFTDLKKYWGGYVTNEGMLQVIARSKINLNFLWTSADTKRSTIKGRTMELSACRALQLSNHTSEFDNYGFVDSENIAVFLDESDMLNKVNYYLDHDAKREIIAQNAYDFVIKHHTWKQRFDEVFTSLRTAPRSLPIIHRYRIMVLVHRDVQHQLMCDDERLDIQLLDPKSNWQSQLSEVDAVMQLKHDSSLNNESLYMMIFGLMADKADLMVTNFYVVKKNEKRWIRFSERVMEYRRKLLRSLPAECQMFSSAFVKTYGCQLAPDLAQLKISYLEYPSFRIDLPCYWSRKLRLYFEHHGDSRRHFKLHLIEMRFGHALSLGIDKLWRRIL